MQHKLAGYGVELSSVVQSDIETLRQWRNRDDIRSMMKSTQFISKEQQQAWFDSLEDASHLRHFVVRYKGEPIGSATLVGLSFVSGFTDDLENANEIEPGLYIGHDNYRNNILAFAPSLVICDYCFNELQVNRLVATVNSHNKQALSYNQKLGYQEESRFFADTDERLAEQTGDSDLSVRQEWVSLSLTRKDYLASTKQVRQLLSRHKNQCED